MLKHINLQIREAIINLFRQGKVSRKIAKFLLIDKSTVNTISRLAKYKSTNSLADKPRGGRPRKTTKRVDKMIKRKSIADVKKIAINISRELREENLAGVSRNTVSRHLKKVGLIGPTRSISPTSFKRLKNY